MNIKFYVIQNLSNKALGKIYCYVRSKGETLIVPTDIVVFVKNWDKKQQLAKLGTTNAVLINKKIAKIRETIEATILEETTDNLKIDAAELFAKIKEQFQKNKSKTLGELIEQYIETNKNKFSTSYIKKQTTLKNYLNNFDASLTTYDLNKNFVDAFSNYLINHNLTNVTIAKVFSLLSSCLRWHFNRTIQPFDLSFLKYKGAGNDKGFSLTLDEIKQLTKIKPLNKEEELDLDAFIFACFTGLRFTDVQSFRKSTINNGFIELVQHKTKKKNQIVVLPPAKRILDKYQTDQPFIKLTGQVTNRRLKAIARRAGLKRLINTVIYIGNKRTEESKPINELISFHTARRSFATIMTAANLNPDLIKAMTGHRTHREFERYIKFNDQQLKTIADEINVMFN